MELAARMYLQFPYLNECSAQDRVIYDELTDYFNITKIKDNRAYYSADISLRNSFIYLFAIADAEYFVRNKRRLYAAYCFFCSIGAFNACLIDLARR